MRISDWSSDVCSSDLVAADELRRQRVEFAAQLFERDRVARGVDDRLDRIGLIVAETQAELRLQIAERKPAIERAARGEGDQQQIGRGSGRERVWQDVEISGVTE